MKRSEHYSFYLPSRDSDDDVVDINQISDNFQTIDGALNAKASNLDIEKLSNELTTVNNAVSNIDVAVKTKQDKFAEVTEDENTRTIDFNKKFKGIIKNSDGAVSIEAQHISLNSESDFIDVSAARIENLGTPEYYTDAATKGYVDDAIGEINSVLSTLVTIED